MIEPVPSSRQDDHQDLISLRLIDQVPSSRSDPYRITIKKELTSVGSSQKVMQIKNQNISNSKYFIYASMIDLKSLSA